MSGSAISQISPPWDSENTQRRNEEKKPEYKKWSTDCLLAIRLYLHCVPWFMSPCVHLRERVLPSWWGHMRARAAGRACHCCSLFYLFSFLPEEEKVLHRNQQPLGVTPCHRLSVFDLRTCIFLHDNRKYIYIDTFLSFLNCVCKHARYFLTGSQRVKTSMCNSEADDKTFPEPDAC